MLHLSNFRCSLGSTSDILFLVLFLLCVRALCMCACEKSSLVKKLFRNDTFPHDSVAFSRTANQGSGFGMSCHDAARHQAATKVCRLISAPYCHFVKSHYPNENESGKAVTEHGFRWAVCQKHSHFISLLFLNSKSVARPQQRNKDTGCWHISLCDVLYAIQSSLL